MEATKRSALLTGVGARLTQYELDLDACSVSEQGTIQFPGNVQYAWPHSEKPILYVTTSDRVNRERPGTRHTLSAVQLNADGQPGLLGPSIELPHRAVHITVDSANRHVIAAMNDPAGLLVIGLNEDGTLGDPVEQRAVVDPGIFPHQIRVTPDGRYCVTVARGNPAQKGWWSARGPQRDPGSINVFRYEDGQISDRHSTTIDDGLMFGPRHIDFGPQGQTIYVSVEIENEALVLARGEDDPAALSLLQQFSLIENPDAVLVHQGSGTVHVHPAGHAVYFANRGHRAIPRRDGSSLLPGALIENSLVVCGVDAQSGQLAELQRIDSGGICPRTFSIDPSGRMLVAANAETHLVDHGTETERVRANLSTFEIQDDGRLVFRNRHELDLPLHEEAPSEQIAWCGIVAL